MFQNDFGAFMHVMDCTYIAIFFCSVRWRHSKPPNSGLQFLAIFYQFEEGVANWRRQLCMDFDAVFAVC